MPIDLSSFVQLRPFLYHLTSPANLRRILRTGHLESAANIMAVAKRDDLLRLRRREHVPISVEGEIITLRDQAPLYAGNLALPRDWTFEDFIADLNDRVFFWPGGTHGPISHGVRHFERYADERPVILLVSTGDLLAANSKNAPLFCRYNSGSPRCSNGMKSPRGPMTFVAGPNADFRASKTVEVTFSGRVRLPTTVEAGPATSPARFRRALTDRRP
jgi:hypothetical protein